MIKIETLNKTHNRKSFDCANESLNQYLQQTARQHFEKGIARTFVLIDDIMPRDILGFLTLVVCEIHTEELPIQFAKKYHCTGCQIGASCRFKNSATTRVRQIDDD